MKPARSKFDTRNLQERNGRKKFGPCWSSHILQNTRRFGIYIILPYFFFHFTAKGKLNNNNNNKNFDVYKSNFTQQVSCEGIAIFFPLLLQPGQATNLHVIDRI